MVDLRGRLSNPEAIEAVTLARLAMAGRKVDGASVGAAPRGTRPWRLVDGLGDQLITDLLRDGRAGATKLSLAKRYGISLSSVKRIFRTQRRTQTL